MSKISNWGKYPVVAGPELSNPAYIPAPGEGSWIPRGMGRCYGDSSLGETMISSLKLDRMLDFDEQNGILTCEAGVTYEDLLATFVPKGWFPPVTPGTKFVSLGGALASDVHGKNHHKEGSISAYVLSFDLLLPAGSVVSCSRSENQELFWATVGGMGLTGMILRLRIQLKAIETSAIKYHNIKAGSLAEILALFDEFGQATYSVAWIDTIAGGRKRGRSILMKGEHASKEETKGSAWEKTPLALPKKLPLTVPFNFPSFALNPLTISIFNTLYYGKQLKHQKEGIMDYDSFFYPLDAIHHWNRIYGKRGFTQYQFVVPREAGAEAIETVLKHMKKHRMGSFLSVLKLLGPSSGLISFPMEGYTLTLDFPIKKNLFPFLHELDEMVKGWGGRVYLTKDVRMQPAMMEATYPGVETFRALRREIDPEKRVLSFQAKRLNL
ncbi:MAG: FAD-binding oxidoreductase [Bacteroidia bacterium]|nr:FAD-binding oxidoreductase [Bacteroidia bacterium]